MFVITGGISKNECNGGPADKKFYSGYRLAGLKIGSDGDSYSIELDQQLTKIPVVMVAPLGKYPILFINDLRSFPSVKNPISFTGRLLRVKVTSDSTNTGASPHQRPVVDIIPPDQDHEPRPILIPPKNQDNESRIIPPDQGGPVPSSGRKRARLRRRGPYVPRQRKRKPRSKETLPRRAEQSSIVELRSTNEPVGLYRIFTTVIEDFRSYFSDRGLSNKSPLLNRALSSMTKCFKSCTSASQNVHHIFPNPM